ncbi:hypothetical protein HMPREF1544_11912, partial [Mucor circinelloides 1006PhL]
DADPAAFILFILVILFYGRFVSDHALEIMMLAFNMLFKVLEISYRFPCRVEPSKRWIKNQTDIHAGITEFVKCQTCSSIIYPYHSPQQKTFNLKSNDATTPSALTNKYIPIKRFYHNSLIHTLKTFMRRKLFADMLEETFARNASGFGKPWNYTADIQHGSSPFNLLLLLNLDWFSPFELSSYSIGGVWLSILNLDHEERLLRKNTILSGVLPGPREVT